MKGKVKTVRLWPENYKALRKLQSQIEIKLNLELLANGAIKIGLPDVEAWSKMKQNTK
jgi:hypothetical protein